MSLAAQEKRCSSSSSSNCASFVAMAESSLPWFISKKPSHRAAGQDVQKGLSDPAGKGYAVQRNTTQCNGTRAHRVQVQDIGGQIRGFQASRQLLLKMVLFFNTAGSQDGAWVLFFLVVLCSSMFGKNPVFKYLQIPIITGYMIIGFLFGPYVFAAINKIQVTELTYVNQAALSFIAMSAGAEIYLPEIMPLLRPIGWISCAMIFFTMLIGTAFVYGVGGTPLLPWLVGYNSCNFGVAMLAATILAARSPTSVLAVVRELQAKGEVTSIMIGITVAGDVFVLTIFAIVSAMTQNFCSGTAFDAATFMVNLVMIPVAVIWGGLLGLMIVQMLRFEQLKHAILPLGFLNYLICDYILAVSTAQGDFEIDIDALLICITAGFVVGNSPQREVMVEYLNSLSMYVFIPFFTQVGLQLNLPVLIKALGFSITASLVRAFCMMCGTYTGGVYVGLPKDKALRLWMGLIPQAGVALGLAGIVGHQYNDTFGPAFQSTVLGVILTNQVIGPIGAKYLIKYAQEDGKSDGDEDEHGLKKTIAAFNDGHVEDHEGVNTDTQTEDDMFLVAAKGVLPVAGDHEAGGEHAHSNGEGDGSPPRHGEVTAAEAYEQAVASRGKVHRRASVRLVAPRRKLERGGYAVLHDQQGDNGGGDGDIELHARGGGVPSGEAVNPMWGGEEGEQPQQGSGDGEGAVKSPWAGLLNFGASK